MEFIQLPTSLFSCLLRCSLSLSPLLLSSLLFSVSQVVADQIPMLVQGVRGSQSQPDSPSAQLTLIGAGQNFLQVTPPTA